METSLVDAPSELDEGLDRGGVMRVVDALAEHRAAFRRLANAVQWRNGRWSLTAIGGDTAVCCLDLYDDWTHHGIMPTDAEQICQWIETHLGAVADEGDIWPLWGDGKAGGTERWFREQLSWAWIYAFPEWVENRCYTGGAFQLRVGFDPGDPDSIGWHQRMDVATARELARWLRSRVLCDIEGE